MDFDSLFKGRFFGITYAVIFAVLSIPAFRIFPTHPNLIGAIFIVMVSLIVVGIHDINQTRHAILRNYPIIGHLRFFFEKIRPEMRQYFFEGDTDGMPFPRERRAIVYQRAKRELDKKPFGTQGNVYAEGHEWMLHSIVPAPLAKELFRLTIGGPDCTNPIMPRS